MATWTGKQSPSVLMSISVAFLYPSAKIFLFFFSPTPKKTRFLLFVICFNFAKRAFKQRDVRRPRVNHPCRSIQPGLLLLAVNISPLLPAQPFRLLPGRHRVPAAGTLVLAPWHRDHGVGMAAAP